MSKKIYRNKRSRDNIVISIEGVHGVGKTTIFNLFKKKAGESNHKFKFLPERYVKVPPFPFGSQDKQIAFRSELHFLQQFIKRNQNVTNFVEKYNGRIIILDRSPLCVLIYSKSLNLKEKDYHLIEDTYNSVKWKEDHIIYLTAEVDTLLKRIIQRGSLEKIRKEWNEGEKEYILKILSFYNQFLVPKKEKNKITIITTENKTPEQVLTEIEQVITELSGYSFKSLIEEPPKQMNILKFLQD